MQCAQSCAFSIESFDQTGATIDTSWGQLMISPHGGDNMLARFQAGVICLSTYFTGKIFVCQLFVSFERRVAPCSDIRQNEATNKGFYFSYFYIVDFHSAFTFAKRDLRRED